MERIIIVSVCLFVVSATGGLRPSNMSSEDDFGVSNVVGISCGPKKVPS